MALKDDEEIDDNESGDENPIEPIPLSSLRPKTEEEEEEKIQKIPIDIKKKQTDNTATMNIKKPGFIKDYVSEPTRDASDYGKQGGSSASSASSSSSAAPKTGESVEEIRARLEAEEKEEVSKLSVEDFEDMADFIIDLVDMGMLFGLRMYSQDISDAEYKVPEEKLKKLKKHLSRILMRVGKKFPMGMLLILGILAAYATPMRKAHEHRKKVLAEKTRKQMDKATKTEKVEKDEEDDGPVYVPIKKRKGGQSK